ncbi:hypothetical protein SAMN05421855_10834 [Ulvibacter litoralis]|uniref:Uncharacterized protein n=2 Tax=Ulvibacter litoralis TaxID=227084 RepID=A0A1G7J167_9FLAO|nr:hypothetical protein SAMN05421855_10834 [Ulvibacter litoralis]
MSIYLKFQIIAFVLLSTTSCTKQKEIVVTELQSELPIYFDYDGEKEVLWRLNVPQKIQIENTKSYDIFLESVQQIRDLSSARVFELKNGKLHDTHFKKNLIKKGDLKTFIITSNHHITNKSLVYQESLKELFINKKGEIINDSIPVEYINNLKPNQRNLIKAIIAKDSLEIHFLKDKSSPGFEKPVKIPVAR